MNTILIALSLSLILLSIAFAFLCRLLRQLREEEEGQEDSE